MGKAAEPADDIGVVLGPFQVFGIPCGACQLDAAELVGEVLRMIEGQIEEFAQGRIDPCVDAVLDGAVRHLARQGIAGIGPRIAAEYVAGKLIEHDHERQRAVIARFP